MNSAQACSIADLCNPKPELTPISPLIEGVEKLEHWLAHREIVVPELCPVGALETLYAQRAALYLWRLDRVGRSEIAAKIGASEARSTSTCEDSANPQERRASTDPPTLQTIIKYEAHLQRCLAGTMAELRRLQKDRRQGLRDANPGGRGADRAVIPQNESVETGSHGGSSSPKSSPARKKAIHGKHPASQRASPISKPPQLLASITNRRRLEEYTRGEIFERKLGSVTLDFAMITHS